MFEHEDAQRLLRPVQRDLVVDLLLQIGLQGLVIDALAHREHDDHRHEHGQTGQHLRGRQLLHPHGLPQEAEDDDDAREAGDRQHDGRRHGKDGQEEKDLQQDGDLAGFGRAAGERELHTGQGEILRGPHLLRGEDRQRQRREQKRQRSAPGGAENPDKAFHGQDFPPSADRSAGRSRRAAACDS